MTRLVKFTEGEYFHVYNRGTNKMQIFLNEYDHSRFQMLLYTANSKDTIKFSDIDSDPYRVWEIKRGETLVDIGAYTLMPNHFHILIRSKNEKDTALFLQRILLSYSKYFNYKNERTGSLFQGKSKAEHLTNDLYLKYIYSYIHLNMVKLIQPDWKEVGIKNIEKVKKSLNDYRYSSFIDYNGTERPESKILNRDVFPNYFEETDDFTKEIETFLNYNK